MQEANRYRTEFIGEISRYSLIGLLIINILYPFAILFINPEAYLFGQKIAGTPALVYALGLILVTALVMFCLFWKTKGNEVIALVYGVIYFISGYLNVLNITGQSPPVIYWLVLAVSVILFGATLLIACGNPAGKNEKSISTVFTEKPSAGLLVSAGVFFCFLLIMGVSLISYQKEYDSYLYQIEIAPETQLHNVTLIVPLPTGISRNITEQVLVGSSQDEFTNYSQSVVDTGNGTMIKITADSIERPVNGLPREPARLYQSVLTDTPVNYSAPLEREPVLQPKFSLASSPCTGKSFQDLLTGISPVRCMEYGSAVFAEFDTAPSSRTRLIVFIAGTREISSSQSPQRNGYDDRISVMFQGPASGWYNASGTLLAG